MSGIKQGFLFVWLSLKRATSNPIYWKYFGLLFLGGIIFLTISWIPVYFVLLFLGSQFWGLFALGVIAILLLISLLAWGEILSLPITRAYSQSEFDSKASQPGKGTINLGGWQAMLGLALAKPFLKSNKKAHLSKNAYLAKPIIALENTKLPPAIERTNFLAENQSLYFNPGIIKVHFVSWLIFFISLIVGIGLGTALGLWLTQSPLTTLPQRLGGLAVAMFIAFIFTMIGIAISLLSRGLYDANLYQWVKDTVVMSQSETKNAIAIPGMINQVLSQ